MSQLMNTNVRQMKDFLEIFNKVTETCFNNCVNTFADRELSVEEGVCLDNCVTKILKSGQVAMGTYVEIQPKLVEKRIQEFNEIAEKNTVVENVGTEIKT